MVGRTIGKYRIVEQIGRGGMGTVYKGIDETLDRRVAIKLLNADLIDQDAVERFRREAVTLAKLNHGRIGAIHELTRDGHDLLMVMEYLDGETCEKLIERGPLTVPQAVRLLGQVLDALQYAHGAGVVHRDLKPANIMITPSGDIKVMDFGIARVQGSEHLTTNGFMVGTPAYMAPEQVRGEEVDPRMDLYAIAVVLYRMLTQRLPFHGDTAIAMIHSQLNNPPTPPQQFRADLPEWMVRILDRGLSKKPIDRFQSASEFRAALEGGLTGKILIPPVPTGNEETIGPMLTPPEMRTPAMANAPTVPSGVQPPIAPSAIAAAPAPAPAAPMGRPSSTESTITLRAPHLATAGVLLALLVIGIGVLAFIALRRPASIVAPVQVEAPTTPAPAANPTSAAPEAAAATPDASPAAPASPGAPASIAGSSTPASASPAAPPAATTTANAAPAGQQRPAASAGASAGNAAQPPAASAAGRGTPPAPSASAGPAAGRATAAPSTIPGAAASATPAVPATPAAASAPTENFGDIKTLVVDGNRSREVDALLNLEPGNLVVRSRSDGSVIRSVPYTSIAAATYIRSRRPRGQTAPGAMPLPENVGGAGVFGGARHWLTLQMATEFLIIRLEDRNMIRVVMGVENRTGKTVLRARDE